MNWLLRNKEWFFSGIGVFLLAAFCAFLKRVSSGCSGNHPDISIHTQQVDISGRGFHESFDNALGVFIANTGDSHIYIRRALFRNRVPYLLVFRRASQIPVYLKAFKDAEFNAYELKFGQQWYD